MVSYETSTSATTWYEWNDTHSTTSMTTGDYTWKVWCQTDTAVTTVTGTASTVWVEWNGGYRGYNVGVVEQRTPEQIAEQARRERERAEEHRRKAEEQARLAKEADARAAELLKAHLTEAQRQEFEREQAFTVISRDGERRYRVNKGWSHNVQRIDAQGKPIHTLCAHPSQDVPAFDNMLAQKLMLEHNEEEFLKIANKGQIRRAG